MKNLSILLILSVLSAAQDRNRIQLTFCHFAPIQQDGNRVRTWRVGRVVRFQHTVALAETLYDG